LDQHPTELNLVTLNM